MSHPFVFPETMLRQHIAVLGKTGSGKTSTGKLIVEQAVAEGARVCILDPIKSDWWGLTSSSDGKKPGLPFHILGGPRGHVALHAKAGAAIGEIVANGQLPLSILDMADFEMGGLQTFFVDFAQTLLRKMKGVVYLVIEEAHEFAPKERGGFGNENMAIHFAKKLAVAGRSRGIRIILATQRTQSLHNALLGSCDTLIAHRMTAPADQTPIVTWLKANLPPEKAKEVAASLQSLKTGEAWICSGELNLFERRQFPRITTYDNTSTPTHDGDSIEVKTAPVDHDNLRKIIGVAVDDAKANDPRELKAELAKLRTKVAQLESNPLVQVSPPLEVPVITDGQMAEMTVMFSDFSELVAKAQRIQGEFKSAIDELKAGKLKGPIVRPADFAQLPNRKVQLAFPNPPGSRVPAAKSHPLLGAASGEMASGGVRRMLIAIAQRPGINQRQIGIRARVSSKSGSFRTYLSKMRANEWVTENGDSYIITLAGSTAIGHYEPLPEGRALLEHYISELGNGGSGRLLRVIAAAYPNAVSKEEAGRAADISHESGSFRTYLSKLRTLELIAVLGDQLRASDELFT